MDQGQGQGQGQGREGGKKPTCPGEEESKTYNLEKRRIRTFLGDVDGEEEGARAERLGDLLAELLVAVEQDDATALGQDRASSTLTETRSATGDDEDEAFDLHEGLEGE